MNPSNTTLDEIQRGLDSYFAFFNNEWTSPLIMCMHVGFDSALNAVTLDTDINEFIGNKEKSFLVGDHAYFSREKYPPPHPPLDKAKVYDAFQVLYKDLICQARTSGFELVQKGRVPESQLAKCKNSTGTGNPLDGWDLICSRYYTYEARRGKHLSRSNDEETLDTQQGHVGSADYSQYRNTNLHGDRWNTRGAHGKSMIRKRNTNKALTKADCCRYSIRVYFDEHGFFIKRTGKDRVHCGHMRRMPQDIPARLRYLSEANKTEIARLGNAFTTASAGRTFAHCNFGQTVTREQMRYAYRKYDRQGVYHFDGVEVNSVSMVSWLREQTGISYCIWGAKPESAVAAESALVFNEESIPGQPPVVRNLVDLAEDVLHLYKEECEALELKSKQHMFIGAAWCSAKGKRLFKLLPDVLKIDSTCGSGKEARPLCTASIRTANGKYVIVAYMMLPNERKITFRWVFSVALPLLFGSDLSRVKVIVTDGDSNEIDEVELARKTHLPHTFRIRCGWHIVHQGFKKNVDMPRVVGDAGKATRRRQFRRLVCRWLYTFMHPGYYESSTELLLSKCMLLAYINQPILLVGRKNGFLTREIVQSLQKFLVGHVYVHDECFAFYPRMGIRCYNEATNSSHEGTNLGLKAHHAAIQPGSSEAYNSTLMKLQSDIKANEMERLASTRLEAQPLWCQLPTAGQVTEFCHELVVGNWIKGKANYHVLRASERLVWKVVAAKKEAESEVIPVFRHVRTVSLDATGRLVCSCKHFERCAYPCRHQAAVVQMEDPSHPGFGHHDCGIQWWKKFVHHGLRGVSETNTLDEVLQQLLIRDITGPSPSEKILKLVWDNSHQPGHLNEEETIDEYRNKFAEEEPMKMCLNFSSTTLERAMNVFASIASKTGVTHIDNVGFLSQESHQDDSSVLPSFPTSGNTFLQQSQQELLGFNDAFSDDEDGLQLFTCNEIDKQLADGETRDPAQSFIDEIDRETRELKNLIRSRNYITGMIDEAGIITAIREAQLKIKRKMHANSNPDKNAEWVSCCPQRSKKVKRFHASKNC